MSLSSLKPILALLILSSFLTEVLTGSTPLILFIDPVVFLLFITVGYGFPVLIIRELFVRRGLSFLSLFILGLAYGLWNEGLFAQTIFHPFHAPIESFATYGLIENIRIPFALTISSWHALYAVIFPIMLAHYLFPSQAQTPWISKKVAWSLGIGSVAFGTVSFFHNLHTSEFADMPGSFAGNPMHFIFLIVSMTILFISALLLPHTQPSTASLLISTKRLLIYGCSAFLLYFIFPVLIAGPHLPIIFFYLYFCLLFFFTPKILAHVALLSDRQRILLMFAGEVTLALFGGTLALFTGNILQAVVVFSCMGVFIYQIFTLRAHIKTTRF